MRSCPGRLWVSTASVGGYSNNYSVDCVAITNTDAHADPNRND
ncbi:MULTISPECIES: hypothetical protein [Arthrobacter]|nr:MULTISPECIES: hypothetical protein [Arthrobacter]